MSETAARVAVVGAGLGGLALAQSIRRTGLDLVVLEKDLSFAAPGRTVRVHCDPRLNEMAAACLPPRLFELFVACQSRPDARHIYLDERLKLVSVDERPAPELVLDTRTAREVLAVGLGEHLMLGAEVRAVRDIGRARSARPGVGSPARGRPVRAGLRRGRRRAPGARVRPDGSRRRAVVLLRRRGPGGTTRSHAAALAGRGVRRRRRWRGQGGDGALRTVRGLRAARRPRERRGRRSAAPAELRVLERDRPVEPLPVRSQGLGREPGGGGRAPVRDDAPLRPVAARVVRPGRDGELRVLAAAHLGAGGAATAVSEDHPHR